MESFSVWHWLGLFVAAALGVILNLSTHQDIKGWVRKHWEVLLIRLAAWILIERNVVRSSVVSRRDNNDMWYMSEKLEGICKRMINEYQDEQ